MKKKWIMLAVMMAVALAFVWEGAVLTFYEADGTAAVVMMLLAFPFIGLIAWWLYSHKIRDAAAKAGVSVEELKKQRTEAWLEGLRKQEDEERRLAEEKKRMAEQRQTEMDSSLAEIRGVARRGNVSLEDIEGVLGAPMKSGAWCFWIDGVVFGVLNFLACCLVEVIVSDASLKTRIQAPILVGELLLVVQLYRGSVENRRKGFWFAFLGYLLAYAVIGLFQGIVTGIENAERQRDSWRDDWRYSSTSEPFNEHEGEWGYI